MHGDYTSAIDPSYCPVHGAGARVERWAEPKHYGTGKGVRWWVCPQCTEMLVGGSVVNAMVMPVFQVAGVEGLESLVAAAKETQVVLYEDPRTLDYETLEEGVRGPCRRINESGWCFTAESCHGHVHERTKDLGSWGDDPFIRLTARREHFGHMLMLFAQAMTYDDSDSYGISLGKRTLQFNVSRDDRGEPVFMSAIVRIPAPRVYVRNLALEAFGRFAELVNGELP